MKKIVVFIVLVLMVVLLVRYLDKPSDYKQAEYLVDGKKVSLDGAFRYFGNELKTDLDGDGREDLVFFITQTKGSDTFFYAAAALNTSSGYVGSEAYPLGKGISPQTINLSPNPRQVRVIAVNYAEGTPSIGKSTYLKLDPQTLRWAIVEPNFEGESR